MDIKDRIRLIMEHEGMTAAAFAESIDVAQATISHTLGDRNKYPSTDFIMKLHDRFKNISLDWLLTGNGEMIANDATNANTEPQTNSNPSLFYNENPLNPTNLSTSSEKRKEMALANTEKGNEIPVNHTITREILINK